MSTIKERFAEQFSDDEDINCVPHLKAHGFNSSKPSGKVLAFFQQERKQELLALAEEIYFKEHTADGVSYLKADEIVEFIRSKADDLT